MKIIVLDTETTGIMEKDRICQLSFLVLNVEMEIEEIHNEVCKPPLPISYEAMAVHHITPEKVADAPACVQTKAYERLLQLNTQENILVIHNAAFDLLMLAKEGFTSQMNLIDTFRILRAYYPFDGSFALQYKRYQWGLYQREEALATQYGIIIHAHDALGDVIVLKHLFERLCEEHSMPKMILLCSEPIVLSHIPYGKNKGKKFVDVAQTERQDLHYMLNANGLDADVKASILHALEATKENVTLTIGFGKYAGKTPEEVLEIDRNYLLWMLNKMENLSSELKEAIEKVLGSNP
ncbi:3'-5' exonuclease [Sulfurospirillum barnesii]|uniref:DNA polymerase III epsilon subunit-like 3'-5' exonuclease n=1 Tax=Sulfurospirillum barnesii (strain ATCC 700032 / DSM 10660 / SES-3) TaxID=760154 RepID=I3XWF7_SULBS|nr:3'-5' exonuclease [Sulfurospirillum barnesii]AFL68281.1 DNA polymerase III epsilon subunit-like 3'-5' exonuclease [Sulfurospirillum barnesii SES-3]